MVLEDGDTSRAGWIDYDPNNPSMQLFTSRKTEDNLAFLTTEIDKATYAKLSRGIPFLRDQIAYEEFVKENPNWDSSLFLSLDKYVPISNAGITEASTDLADACPAHPQKKNGEPCDKRDAIDLPQQVLLEILKATEEINRENGTQVDPALVAAIIHHETDFRLFTENLHEKQKCKNGQCSDYGWGKGFAQLGKTDSEEYGLNWNEDPPNFSKCNADGFANSRCFKQVNEYCEKNFTLNTLKPYYCPNAAIKAVAKKISKLIPKTHNVHLRGEDGSLREVDLGKALNQNEEILLRNQVAAYNRRPARVFNSYSQFIQQNGDLPKEFGEAWSTLRQGNFTPTRNIGYGMLTREFINRCYVWNVAGLCGEIPEESLLTNYRSQMKDPQIISLFKKECENMMKNVAPLAGEEKSFSDLLEHLDW